MRLLHTSDWHLGQNFMGKSRESEHRALIKWVLKQIVKYEVDALVIAGDIFDTGTPPSYARKIYNNFMVDLNRTGCKNVIVVGGNHDSVATLEESKELFACLNITVIGGVAQNAEDQIVILKKRNNDLGAIICAVPYIRPRDVVTSKSAESAEDKQYALQEGIANHYSTLYSKACDLRTALGSDELIPIIATGHLTAVGGKSSESVRDIYIGTLEAFPVKSFPPADYIALGHLHKKQVVGGREHIRYCGSPIPLSFGEAIEDKEVLLVDFEGGQLKQLRPLIVPRFQEMRVVTGSLIELKQQIEAMDSPQKGEVVWLEVEVREDDYLSDLTKKIEEFIEGKPIEVLRVKRLRKGGRVGLTAVATETLTELKETEVFSRRLQQESLDEVMKKRLQEAFSLVVNDLEQTDILQDKHQSKRSIK